MDNHHVNVSTSQISCGVLEVSRIESDTNKVLYAIASHLYHPSRGQPVAFAIWSDVLEGNGHRLAHIVSMGSSFGKLTVSPVLENPKTSNGIQVYVWGIDHEGFREWYRQQRIERASRT